MRQKDRRMDIRTLGSNLPSDQIGEHLGLKVGTGVRTLDGAATSLIREGPVHDVAREDTGVALNLDQEQPLARQKE
jgi:hypothetical protein